MSQREYVWTSEPLLLCRTNVFFAILTGANAARLMRDIQVGDDEDQGNGATEVLARTSNSSESRGHSLDISISAVEAFVQSTNRCTLSDRISLVDKAELLDIVTNETYYMHLV